MKIIKAFPLLLVASFLIISSCKKDKFIVDSNAQLSFSVDSVVFDTVFTQIGSTTKIFKIYNTHNQKINISKIYLANGSSSQFRLNVDGNSGAAISDIEMLANDSLFVFVQVTIDPNNSNSPLLIKDSIVFNTNGNVQDVKLAAVGQDVWLHKPNVFPTNGLPPYSVIDCSIPWTNDKPHLVFGYAVVDSDCQLTINAGTKVYMNTGAVLWVFKDGTLNIQGAKDDEVTFQGARLESSYSDIPGQWGKIWMMAGSKNNRINWAILKNGSIGVQLDSLGTAANAPLLRISNTTIHNMSSAAIYAKTSHIWGNNCVFSNCGQYVAALTIGGIYRFEHCTFANYWNQSIRNTSLLLLNNYHTVENNAFIYNLDTALFSNCILYGNKTDEIDLDPASQAGTFSYKFNNCLLKTSLSTTDPIYFKSAITNTDPEFIDISENNYQLKARSVAIDKGETNTIPLDLKEQDRPNPNTSIPDIGAYEFY